MPWRNVALLLNEGHLVDLLDAGNSLANLGQTAFAKRDHSFFAGDAFDFGCRPAIDNHLADAIGEIEQFADCRTPMIAGAGTLEASDAFGDRHAGPDGRIETSFLEF